MYSGFGGQVDFIRGAAEGYDGKGKPIVALMSVTNKGESKIVPVLKQGKFHKSIIFSIFLSLKHVCIYRCRCCNF